MALRNENMIANGEIPVEQPAEQPAGLSMEQLDHEFLGNDGQYHKVRDYWKEEANIMLAGINAHEAEEADNREAILQGEKDAYENGRVYF